MLIGFFFYILFVVQAIRVFFMVRNLSFTLRQEPELHLPLTKEEECVKVDDVLNLSESNILSPFYMFRALPVCCSYLIYVLPVFVVLLT